MRTRIALVVGLLACAGCSPSTNDALVGDWEATNGEIWKLRSDGTFEFGGARSSGPTTLCRSGKWSERDGTLRLEFKVPSGERAEFRWVNVDGRLRLTQPGQDAQTHVLQRVD